VTPISMLKLPNNLVTLKFQFVSNQDHLLPMKVRNNPTKKKVMLINPKKMLNNQKKLAKWEIIAISLYMSKETDNNRF